MVQLRTYTNADLPGRLAQQITDFVRINWYDAYKDGPQPYAASEDLSPVYHVIAEGEALYSSTTVVRRRIEHDGDSFMCYGLSAVLTYPFFRKRGYGREVVDSATESILAAPDADIAWLQTMPELKDFYGHAGWEHLPDLHTLSGEPESPEDQNSYAMMLFISERARQNRPAFETAQLYLGEYLW
jgi:GNAT superfamily N-acetyltransferase